MHSWLQQTTCLPHPQARIGNIARGQWEIETIFVTAVRRIVAAREISLHSGLDPWLQSWQSSAALHE
jgi:hypothetical protein